MCRQAEKRPADGEEEDIYGTADTASADADEPSAKRQRLESDADAAGGEAELGDKASDDELVAVSSNIALRLQAAEQLFTHACSAACQALSVHCMLQAAEIYAVSERKAAAVAVSTKITFQTVDALRGAAPICDMAGERRQLLTRVKPRVLAARA